MRTAGLTSECHCRIVRGRRDLWAHCSRIPSHLCITYSHSFALMGVYVCAGRTGDRGVLQVNVVYYTQDIPVR